MAEIIPAILPKNFAELDDKLASARLVTRVVQIDVCDGKLTPDETWPYRHGVIADDTFLNILNEAEGLPFWKDLDFEIDLMAKNPEESVPQWIIAGASRIIVHVETISDFKKIKDAVGDSVELGLAINIDTSTSALLPFVSEVTSIQCMGIAKIGFQGQPFDTRVVDRVRQLRQAYPEHIISVDGGVNLENATGLISAGAQRLVVGSALWQNGSLRENLAQFKKL